MDSSANVGADRPVKRSRRPTESAFYQQRLPVCQPNWTPRVMSPVLIAFGIIFICIGSVLLHVSLDTPEFSLDYTHCVAHQDHLNRSCAEILSWQHGGTCECIVEITLEQHFPRDVFFYYGLENFHQNHRMFVRSRDDGQLRGNIDKDPSPYCDPFRYTEHNNQTRPVAPCGLIANAIFNDSFSLHQLPSRRLVPLVGGGSIWAHERELKFRNPPDVDLREALEAHNISRPPSWSRELWELDPANPENNGFQNEDLINWMRSAALPSFRKRHRRVDHSVVPFERGLPSGSYALHIRYAYPVVSFGGRKSIVLSSPSWMGARNHFLGSMFVGVGILKLLLGCVLIGVHFLPRRIRMNDA